MLRLSKKTDYGLLALNYLASEAPAGVAQRDQLAADLARRLAFASFGHLGSSRGRPGGARGPARRLRPNRPHNALFLG